MAGNRLLLCGWRTVLCTVVAVCGATGVAGCRSRRTSAVPVKHSPDGTQVLVATVNQDRSDAQRYLCVKFEVRDQAGKATYAYQTAASDHMRWSLDWEGNDTIVLTSSDIGTYRWKRGDDGTWRAADKDTFGHEIDVGSQ